MKRVTPWVVAVAVVLGCGGMDTLELDELDEGPFGTEELDEREAYDEPVDGFEAAPLALDESTDGPGVFVVERLPDDDGEPLLSDEFVTNPPE